MPSAIYLWFDSEESLTVYVQNTNLIAISRIDSIENVDWALAYRTQTNESSIKLVYNSIFLL